jgi:hypothetical protein
MTIPQLNDKGRMADIPLSPGAKITVERRGEIVLIGVNRPAFGKLDEQFGGLFHTEDFLEGRQAEAEGRPPVYQGR